MHRASASARPAMTFRNDEIASDTPRSNRNLISQLLTHCGDRARLLSSRRELERRLTWPGSRTYDLLVAWMVRLFFFERGSAVPDRPTDAIAGPGSHARRRVEWRIIEQV